MKKTIALFLTLLMILTSVNISYAATAEERITGQPGTIKPTVVTNNEIFTDEGKYIGFMNFDFTNCLPKLYLANTVKLTVKSGVWSASNDNKFSLEIIPDSKEIYTDFEGDNYSDAVAGGILSDGIEILPATVIGSNGNANGTHQTSDIKSQIIEALESGDNNKISIRLVLAEAVESYNVGLEKYPEMTIEYDYAEVTDEAYYEEILKSFNLEEKANIDLDNITSDFSLPTFYKGSNISWTSNKANIAVSPDGTASVTKPADNDEEVTLTATLSYKDGSSYEATFEANVIKKSAWEKLADKFNSTYKVSEEDYSAITKDLKLDKTFEGATLTWKSSNINAVHPVTGKIVPSASEDTTVSLTPTISSDGVSIQLPSIDVTLKKYEGKIISRISGTMALTTLSGWGTAASSDQSESRLYVSRGSNDTDNAYNRHVPFIQFDINDIKDTIYYADSMYLKLHTIEIPNTEHSDEERYSIYLIKNNDWDSTLTYDKAKEKGMNPQHASGADEYEVYSSHVGKMANNVDYKTTDILPYVKDYIKNNPDETKISFKIYTPYNKTTFAFYGTGSDDARKPSIEVRYNFDTPGIEAVKNSDGSFSAVIKSNEAVAAKYTLYFASYATDNTLVGLYASFVNALNEGTTRVDADANEFLTNDAVKVKCILLKGDTLTPACKNAEVPN